VAYTIIDGTTIRFYLKKPFATFAGTPVDPDAVTLTISIQGQPSTTYSYGSGVIVRDGVGLYHADIDTTGKPGFWIFSWFGYPTAAHIDATRTKVRVEGNVTISASTV
jgi:hypothetical protein